MEDEEEVFLRWVKEGDLDAVTKRVEALEKKVQKEEEEEEEEEVEEDEEERKKKDKATRQRVEALVNAKEKSGHLRTCLHYACEKGHIPMIDFLLSKGAEQSKDVKDKYELTPFFAAVKQNCGEAVAYLLSLGFDPNVTSGSSKETPLLWAVAYGKPDLIQVLLPSKEEASSQSAQMKQTNVNHKGEGSYQGRTPLHIVAANGRTDVLSRLLENGADVEAVDNDNRTPIFSAVKYHREEVLQMLIQAGANLAHRDLHGRTALHFACATNDLNLVRLLLEAEPSLLEVKDKVNQTCLFSAAKYFKEPSVLEYLIDTKGANINVRDRLGRTPLHVASASGKLDAVELMLEKGALPDIQDNKKQTPLYSAIKFGCTDVLIHLLQAKPSHISLTDLSGSTPLHHAVKEKSLESVRVLLQQPNLEVHQKDKLGKTPFDYAVTSDIRDEFLSYFAANNKNNNNTSPLSSLFSKKRKATDGSSSASASDEIEVIDVDAISSSTSSSSSSSSSSGTVLSSAFFPTTATAISPPKYRRSSLEQSVGSSDKKKENDEDQQKDKAKEEEADEDHYINEDKHADAEDGYDLSTMAYDWPRTQLQKEKEKEKEGRKRENVLVRQPTDETFSYGLNDGADLNVNGVENEQMNQTALYGAVGSSTIKSISGKDVHIGNSEILRMWEIKPEELRMGERLGSGAFGTVFKGTWRSSEVAIKTLHNQSTSALKMFFKEVQLMCKLRHQNIVQYYGVCMHPSQRCLVMEYLPENLNALIKQGPIELSLLVMIAKGIAQGMHYLHCSNVIHRDLKPSNILLDNHWNPKLCDFGVSRESDSTATMTGLGTPLYMAPEMLQTKHYGSKIDVYAFAMVLWRMVTGRKLQDGYELSMQDLSPIQLAFKVCIEKLRPSIPSDCSPVLASLLTSCWDDDPAKRPNFAEIISTLKSLE